MSDSPGEGASQLLLNYPLDPDFTFYSLVSGPHNAEAVAALRDPFALGVSSLVIVAEAGLGKTHLLQAAVGAHQARNGRSAGAYLDCAALSAQLAGCDDLEQALSDFLAQQDAGGLIAVDGLERLQLDPALQEATLFLYNALRAGGGVFVGAAQVAPQEMRNLRDDLKSRLLWGPVLNVEQPDESELGAILDKLAADRGVRLSAELRHFLLLRLPRSIGEASAALVRLDRAALKLQRPLTVPLAKQVLEL
ncbi:HdaA/DnaA family protein [Magnetofaba australis]|uniref:Putative regulatory inactivation of DnaA Hda protein n=1 Tax=Magnetofaba australis IT-1 TaxID=1434232 RepID=A0A1Y2K5Z9_9PROT|nr:DnaA/Hda family protein [Magnetofaba australis]OSM05059.1 putative regulatory inactivation of DnaA Hda protein [Magnetofaba australis IT-1]